MSLVGAFVRRDLRIARSYRLALATQLAGAGTTLLSAGFLSRLVPADQVALEPYGGEYFRFVLVGTAALAFFSTALGSFSTSLQQEQSLGTLEALLSSPRDDRVLLVCGAAWPCLFAAAQLVVYLALGALLFDAQLGTGNLALAGAVLLLTLAAFGAVGLAGASVVVLTKRSGAVLGLVAGAFALLGGVLYPISVLPGWLQAIARALPMAHGLDGVRLALAPNPDTGAIAGDAAVLVGFTAVALPLALWSFAWAARRARRQGTLGLH